MTIGRLQFDCENIMRTVMRLEHPSTGQGPYVCMHGRSQVLCQPSMNPGYGCQPGFRYPEQNPGHYKYGFTSVHQAENWWDRSARMSAAHNGYVLAVYDVPEASIVDDGAQCVFDPAVAKLVAHVDPRRWIDGDLNMLLEAAKEQGKLCAPSTAQSSPSAVSSTTAVLRTLKSRALEIWNTELMFLEEYDGSVQGRFSASAPNTQQIPRSRGQ